MPKIKPIFYIQLTSEAILALTNGITDRYIHGNKLLICTDFDEGLGLCHVKAKPNDANKPKPVIGIFFPIRYVSVVAEVPEAGALGFDPAR